jgi:amino acid transporter
MAEIKRKELFARPASGLVREISIFRATFFDLACAIGNPGIYLAYMGTAGFALVTFGGMPIWSWVLLIAGLFAIPFILAFTGLTTAMPRSGGDYIYTSRILHPFLGWLEGWFLMWASISISSYNWWCVVYNLGIMAKMEAVVNPSYNGLATWIFQSNTLIELGVIEFVLVLGCCLLPTRWYHRLISWTMVICVFAVLLLLVPLVGFSQSTFVANFQAQSNMTEAQVISAAQSAGFSPNYISLPAIAAIIGYAIFAFWGFNFSAYMAGELKGNVTKNVFISLAAAIFMCVFLSTVWVYPLYSAFGYNFTNAWSYLFWSGSSSTPMGVAPMTTLLTALGNPSMTWYLLIVGFPVLILFNFILNLAYVGLITRVMFAQTMDRYWPKALSTVGRRTHQPHFLILLWAILGFVWLVFEVEGFGPGVGIYYGVLLGFLAMLFPAINAIAVKYRRPDLYELIPTWMRKKVLGLPLMAWFGIIWLIFLIPSYVVAEFWPMYSSILSVPISGFLGIIYSTGLISVAFFLVVGVAWYFVSRAIQRRRGIDVDSLFKEIPPE